MSLRLSGLNPLSYQGVEASQPPQMLVVDRAPTATDSLNVNVGTFWLDITNQILYVLISLAGGVATWAPLAAGGGTVTSVSGANGINITGTPTINPTVNLDIPVTIAHGGTNATSMTTTNGVNYFDGTRIVTTGAGTTGQVLTATTGGAPSWQAGGGGGGGITTLTADNGGSTNGPTVLVTGGLGNNITTSIVGTTLNVVVSDTVDHNVQVGNATGSLSSVAPSATAGIPLVSKGSSADPAFDTAVVSGGGTGATSFNAYHVICAGTTSTNPLQTVSSLGTAGQVLTSAGSGALPVWNTPGWVSSWVDVTTTTVNLQVQTGYTMNSASLITATLPATAAYGSIIQIVGKGVGLWKIAQNAGQTIHFGAVDTTTGTGGYLQSTLQYDCVHLLCTVADTDFTVLFSFGNITYV